MGHPSLQHPEGALILWFGFSPWNEPLRQRKLQIQSRIPKEDLEKGLGVYHLMDQKKLDEVYQIEAAKAEDLRKRAAHQDILSFPNQTSLEKRKIVMKEKILSHSSSRVIPFVSSLSAQTYAWQRYLFFRPWYVGKHLGEIGFGEGFGIDYASSFSSSALGYETDLELVRYANHRYSKACFQLSDGINFNLKGKDLILCFEVLQQTKNPEVFLQKLAHAGIDLILSVPAIISSFETT